LMGNAYDAEDAALRAFGGIRSYGAVNARVWPLTKSGSRGRLWLAISSPRRLPYG
jgi:hypothetical protein